MANFEDWILLDQRGELQKIFLNKNKNYKMMVKHKAVANELTESFDLISGIQKVILNAANDISDQTEELDTNLED